MNSGNNRSGTRHIAGHIGQMDVEFAVLLLLVLTASEEDSTFVATDSTDLHPLDCIATPARHIISLTFEGIPIGFFIVNDAID